MAEQAATPLRSPQKSDCGSTYSDADSGYDDHGVITFPVTRTIIRSDENGGKISTSSTEWISVKKGEGESPHSPSELLNDKENSKSMASRQGLNVEESNEYRNETGDNLQPTWEDDSLDDEDFYVARYSKERQNECEQSKSYRITAGPRGLPRPAIRNVSVTNRTHIREETARKIPRRRYRSKSADGRRSGKQSMFSPTYSRILSPETMRKRKAWADILSRDCILEEEYYKVPYEEINREIILGKRLSSSETRLNIMKGFQRKLKTEAADQPTLDGGSGYRMARTNDQSDGVKGPSYAANLKYDSLLGNCKESTTISNSATDDLRKLIADLINEAHFGENNTTMKDRLCSSESTGSSLLQVSAHAPIRKPRTLQLNIQEQETKYETAPQPRTLQPTVQKQIPTTEPTPKPRILQPNIHEEESKTEPKPKPMTLQPKSYENDPKIEPTTKPTTLQLNNREREPKYEQGSCNEENINLKNDYTMQPFGEMSNCRHSDSVDHSSGNNQDYTRDDFTDLVRDGFLLNPARFHNGSDKTDSVQRSYSFNQKIDDLIEHDVKDSVIPISKELHDDSYVNLLSEQKIQQFQDDSPIHHPENPNKYAATNFGTDGNLGVSLFEVTNDRGRNKERSTSSDEGCMNITYSSHDSTDGSKDDLSTGEGSPAGNLKRGRKAVHKKQVSFSTETDEMFYPLTPSDSDSSVFDEDNYEENTALDRADVNDVDSGAESITDDQELVVVKTYQTPGPYNAEIIENIDDNVALSMNKNTMLNNNVITSTNKNMKNNDTNKNIGTMINIMRPTTTYDKADSNKMSTFRPAHENVFKYPPTDGFRANMSIISADNTNINPNNTAVHGDSRMPTYTPENVFKSADVTVTNKNVSSANNANISAKKTFLNGNSAMPAFIHQNVFKHEPTIVSKTKAQQDENLFNPYVNTNLPSTPCNKVSDEEYVRNADMKTFERETKSERQQSLPNKKKFKSHVICSDNAGNTRLPPTPIYKCDPTETDYSSWKKTETELLSKTDRVNIFLSGGKNFTNHEIYFKTNMRTAKPVVTVTRMKVPLSAVQDQWDWFSPYMMQHRKTFEELTKDFRAERLKNFEAEVAAETKALSSMPLSSTAGSPAISCGSPTFSGSSSGCFSDSSTPSPPPEASN